jgi:DNA-binding beta-propeller fold protein YncE
VTRGARLAIVLTATVLLAGCGDSAPGDGLPLELVADVPLGGQSSRFDYQSIDPGRGLLFIAHLGAGAVLVFDTETREVVERVDEVAEAHGVYTIPELGRAFASATGTNELVSIDEDTGRIVGRSPTGEFPDGVTYEPRTERVFVSNKVGGTVSAFGAGGGEALGEVDLGGEVGNVQYDSGTGSVLANAQGRGELVTIDPRSLTVMRRLALPGCQGNHGLLVDSQRRLAFVACEANGRLLVVDLTGMEVADDLPTGDGPDVLAFDPSMRRLYVASESGVVSVFDERRGGVVEIARSELAPSAHTVVVDPETHLVYFPLERVGGQPVLRIMRPTER